MWRLEVWSPGCSGPEKIRCDVRWWRRGNGPGFLFDLKSWILDKIFIQQIAAYVYIYMYIFILLISKYMLFFLFLVEVLSCSDKIVWWCNFFHSWDVKNNLQILDDVNVSKCFLRQQLEPCRNTGSVESVKVYEGFLSLKKRSKTRLFWSIATHHVCHVGSVFRIYKTNSKT